MLEGAGQSKGFRDTGLRLILEALARGLLLFVMLQPGRFTSLRNDNPTMKGQGQADREVTSRARIFIEPENSSFHYRTFVRSQGAAKIVAGTGWVGWGYNRRSVQNEVLLP
jgi:hypothetical protein